MGAKAALTVILSLLTFLGSIAGVILQAVLMYNILTRIHAEPFMWFIFWCGPVVSLSLIVAAKLITMLADRITKEIDGK